MLNDLYTLITSDSAVAALIGTRLYPLRIPQDAALPAVSYQLISQPGHYAHAEGDVGLRRSRVQLTVQANDYARMRSVLAALSDAVSGYRGTTGSTWFQAIFTETVRDEWAEAFERGAGRMDVIIWHRST
jgi:hypothetical protein